MHMPFCFDNFCFKDVLPHSKSDYVLTVEFLLFFFFIQKGFWSYAQIYDHMYQQALYVL